MICWHLLNDATVYQELGTDYLAGKDHPEKRRRHLVSQLEKLGYDVELAPVA